jgi:TonB family protein
VAFLGALALALSLTAPAQQAAPPETPAQAAQQPALPAPGRQPAATGAEKSSEAPPAATARPADASAQQQAGGVTEEQLKRLLVGHALYLRGGYLDNSLSFNEHGVLIGHSPQGSYTLCGVQIEKIRLGKRKVELVGARYGLHFLGALPYEDPAKALDRVRITPKKKMLKIVIDREAVVKPRKAKEKKPAKGGAASAAPAVPAGAAGPGAGGQARASMAEGPADPKGASKTTSPEHAAKVLEEALDRIFAPGLDERMRASMPEFWQLYYQAAAAGTDYRPGDPSVLRQNTVDRKARLLTPFEPASNEFAQAHGVAGMALYHTVIGADGKPGEIAVARPIGFGLDEGAVEAIRSAKFEPALKNGKPVPVLLDLVVQFRIYSKRTAEAGAPEAEKPEKPTEPSLPGPYSVPHR